MAGTLHSFNPPRLHSAQSRQTPRTTPKLQHSLTLQHHFFESGASAQSTRVVPTSANLAWTTPSLSPHDGTYSGCRAQRHCQAARSVGAWCARQFLLHLLCLFFEHNAYGTVSSALRELSLAFIHTSTTGNWVS